MAATNKNLEEEIAKGTFREDLYHRINVIPLIVPPLRERREDIPLLAAHFLKDLARENDAPPKTFSPAALEASGRPALAGQRPGAEKLRLAPGHPDRRVHHRRGRPAASAAQGLTPEESGDGDFIDPFLQVPSFREARALFEKQFLRRKLAECRGNVSLLAEKIGLERSHLSKKLKSYGLEPKKDG